MLYAVMIELYRNDEKDHPIHRITSEFYMTKEQAQEYINVARRQNLPYKKTWIIEFVDPRNT